METREPANYDEFAMHQSLRFSDSLKDLKNLRKQLYSAAEYFELSYTNEDEKQTVVDTLKDYAVKALVNTVDHLGAVSYKVNDLLDKKAEEVSGTELRVSSIEQRLRTCQEYFDHEGFAQQSLLITVPKYHKRYILPVGETIQGGIRTKLKYQECPFDEEDDGHEFKNDKVIEATTRDTPSSLVRKGRSPSPSPRQPGSFSFTDTATKKDLGRRSVSPRRFPLLRSGSLPCRPSSPNPRRPTTPTRVGRQRPLEPRKSTSGCKEADQIPSKSKRLLKALLSRRKPRKDDMLYTYLDEY